MEYVLLAVLFGCAALFGLHFALLYLAPASWSTWLVNRLAAEQGQRLPQRAPLRRLAFRQVTPLWIAQMQRYARARTAEPGAPRTAEPVAPVAPRDITKPVATALLTERQEQAIRNALQRGVSANDLAALLGGTRATRLAQISVVKQALDDEADLARLLTIPRDPALERMVELPA